MDNYRGDFLGSDAYDQSDDDAELELPPVAIGADERRMQVRAYNLWASLLNSRPFPLIADLETGHLPDFDPCSVLLDFSGGAKDPAIRYLGSKLAEECGDAEQIRRLSDVPGRTLLSRITDHYMQIYANQAPIGFEAEFVNLHGRTIMYRGILLPFSGSLSSTSIDLIYGVINWKELADQQTTDALHKEIDRALVTKPRPRESEPLTEWADGPADLSADMLDLNSAFGLSDGMSPWPAPEFGHSEADDDAMSLSDWLAAAREMAHAAQGSEDRSRQALYAAIGRAWDFALAAAEAPQEFAELLEDAGLSRQDRAPLTPVVKLVFGADYDKTRLTEYGSAMAHAQRLGLGRGALSGFLAAAPGGLKGVVHAERRLRREESGKPAIHVDTPREAMVRAEVTRKLREVTPRPLADLDAAGEEFTLVIAQRSPSGEVMLVGEVG
ncbi:MAG: hypothetical protein ABJA20_13540, partial [Novosphingobium sp.]